MVLPLVAGLSSIFAPIGSFITSMVFARNTNKTTKTQTNLAVKQEKTQLEITRKQQLTQLKIAYLNIENQTKLEQNRQTFQADLEQSRQNFQERMEYLRIGTQVSLAQAREAFEFNRQQLSQEHQEELTRFVQSVNVAINQQNLNFQKWRLEQEVALQKDLAAYNRETQLVIASHHRQTALLSPIVHKILENWPISLVPLQILDTHPSDGRVPLRIFISPPNLDYDRSGEAAKGFPKIEKSLAEGLGAFLSPNYPLTSPIRPTELLDGAWESKRFRGGSSIKSLFGMLKSEPTLILESDVDGSYLNLRVAYWGIGQDIYCYERILSRFPYQKILYESAKQRALAWKEEREKLLEAGMGESLEEIDKVYGADNPLNLDLLSKEIKLRNAGIDLKRFPINYKVNRDDWNNLCKVLANCHCLIAGWITDAHYLVNYDVLPLMPQLLSDLLNEESELPIQEVIEAFVSGYKDLFKAIKIEQPHKVPELALYLAKGLANLPDKSFANEMLDYSLQAKTELN